MPTQRRQVQLFLAEDHPPDVTLIQEALRYVGIDFELSHVKDGELAIQALLAVDEGSRPDLIILDLNLPKKTGFDILAALPGNPQVGSVPVIVLTSSNSERDRRRAAELGVAAFLSKPPDLQEFLERVGGAVRAILGRTDAPACWHACGHRAPRKPAMTKSSLRALHQANRSALRRM